MGLCLRGLRETSMFGAWHRHKEACLDYAACVALYHACGDVAKATALDADIATLQALAQEGDAVQRTEA